MPSPVAFLYGTGALLLLAGWGMWRWALHRSRLDREAVEMPYSDASPRIVVRPGTVLELGRGDYCGGLGGLRLRVLKVEPGTYHGEGGPWVRLSGVELGGGGADRGTRIVLVRIAALTGQVAP